MTEGNGRNKPGSDNATSAIAAAWAERADELAAWAWQRLVNRIDVWGGYNALEDRSKEIRRPDGSTYKLGATLTRPPKRSRGRVFLTPQILTRHFQARGPLDVVGLHTTSPDNRSKWGTVEVDQHGEGSTDPAVNFRAVRGWYDILVARGFHPLLTDSNGQGGYHLDVLLAEPIPTPRMFYFLRELVKDHAARGLPKRPETFPKQPQLRDGQGDKGKYGNWVRVPGRHHTRDHCSRVWNGSEWLTGREAIDYVLALAGDSPSLIPEDVEIRYRVWKYRATLPNLGEGQGRDDVAFRFACFLVWDLAIADDLVALPYLEEWDQGNRPPKGRERLLVILHNAREYGGQHAYGAGRNGFTRDDQATAPEQPQHLHQHQHPHQSQDGLAIILDHFKARYAPAFRRGTAIYSETQQREITPTEGCFAPDRELLEKLGLAVNAPKDGKGIVDPDRLPKFFLTWCKPAWQEMLQALREETAADEIVAPAQEDFVAKLSAALHTLVTHGHHRTDDASGVKENVIERRSLLDWCKLFAKPGKWEQIRSLQLWCRKDQEDKLQIALRLELFSSGQAHHRDLAGLKQYGFGQLCERYGVGVVNGDQGRIDGKRVVVLTRSFIDGLLAIPVVTDNGELPFEAAAGREPGEEG
jgi:hypothetical protein